MNYYGKLSDAIDVTGDHRYYGSRYDVYYGNTQWMRDALFMDEEGAKTPQNLEELEKTHVKIGTVDADSFEDVFVMMQGEVWSPEGEARGLIEEAEDVWHTSMSVGDVIFDRKYFCAYMVAPFGFMRLFTDTVC